VLLRPYVLLHFTDGYHHCGACQRLITSLPTTTLHICWATVLMYCNCVTFLGMFEHNIHTHTHTCYHIGTDNMSTAVRSVTILAIYLYLHLCTYSVYVRTCMLRTEIFCSSSALGIHSLAGKTENAFCLHIKYIYIYISAGRGFDSRWCHWNFSVT
jgi:hypothetical protein